MPCDATVGFWLIDPDKPEFLVQYHNAYSANLLVEASGMRERIDNAPPTMADIAKAKAQNEHRKWELEIQFPKKYGRNPEPASPPVSDIDATKLSDEELEQYVALLKKMSNG
jgi:hypothetical protein